MNEEETTDLEYREAAIRMALEYFRVRGDRPTPNEVLHQAAFFENYLRNGK